MGSEQVRVDDIPSPSPRRLCIAGLPVVDAGVPAALAMLRADAVRGVGRVYALVNAYSATLADSSPDYLTAIESDACLPLPDGSGIVFGGDFLGHGRLARCPGPDLLSAFSEAPESGELPAFFLGGASGVAEALVTELRSTNPRLAVAGTFTPPFGDWDDVLSRRMVEMVRDSGAKVLWLGVSAPKQEVWAAQHVERLGIPVVCVGAAFDFLSGTKPRAPRWMRRLGAEWLFRLMTEPRRLWKRYLIGNLKFLQDLLKYRDTCRSRASVSDAGRSN